MPDAVATRRERRTRAGHRARGRRAPALAVARWAGAATLLTASWGVLQLLPPTIDRFEPFWVDGTIGEQTVSRTLTVTVHDDAVIASRVTGDVGIASWYDEDGTWLVVTVDATATAEDRVMFNWAKLRIGDDVFSASDRVDGITRDQLGVDFARSGSLAFELPPDRAHGTATLELASPGLLSEPRLDDVVRVSIDLDTLPRVDEAAVLPPAWTTP